jgi:hypothetical protein
MASGPVYEVTLTIDRDCAEAFDHWLAGHVREMLELPGFVRANIFAADDDEQGRVRRITQYFLESDEALEDYLSGPAEAMRREATDAFEGRFTASRRILHHADTAQETVEPVEACRNCGAPLTGQYCANCGQRARSRLISLWELVRDAVGDLFELESRLWRTLIPLIVRPGKLTREYLLGRRARYMPPFRTYLVLSVVFFLVAFFDPKTQLSILYEPGTTPPSADTAPDAQAVADIRKEVRDELAAEGILTDKQGADPGAADKAAGETDDGLNIECGIDNFDDATMPPWLAKRLTPQRMAEACERITADRGRAFLRQLLDNVPAALFVLLPLMAFVLKILYPLSKRYYVEHLLFVLHYHAFFFLVMTVEILFSRLAALLSVPATVGNVVRFGVSLYVPVYLYKSMRRVYEQGRAITILKFFFLVLSYLCGLVVMLIFVALYTAVSI